MKPVLALLTVAIALSMSVNAADEPVVIGDVSMPAIDSSDAFEQVKKRVGRWEGTQTQGLTGKVIDVSYEYKITSGGNTITETLVEDGVEMLTTYSDQNGELVVKHYCALGTEPVFTVSSISENALEVQLDQSASGLHADHDSFVTSMKWETDADDNDAMVFSATLIIEGEATENIAVLTRAP